MKDRPVPYFGKWVERELGDSSDWIVWLMVSAFGWGFLIGSLIMILYM